MNGVEKLIEKIVSDTDNYEKEIIAKTELEKTEIIKNATNQAQFKADEIIGNAEKDAKEILSRARSIAALEARKQILAAKRDVIKQVFVKTEEKIINMNEDKYIQLMENIATSVIMGGELIFAVADRNIAPKVLTFLQNKGLKNFTLSDKYETEIQKGFIIKNGAVRINYSIKAIIENMSADLEPDIVKMLFPVN